MDDLRLTLDHRTPTSLVRRLTKRALHRWHLAGRADDVLLVITELVQNVTAHTADGGELCLAVTDDTILIEVTDTDPHAPELRRPAPNQIGGRGLLLIASVARRWGCRPSAWAGRAGKTVWAELAVALPC